MPTQTMPVPSLKIGRENLLHCKSELVFQDFKNGESCVNAVVKDYSKRLELISMTIDEVLIEKIMDLNNDIMKASADGMRSLVVRRKHITVH